MKGFRVTKRDGRLEPIELEKIHKVLFWACDGITGVSVSEIELKAQLQFYDKITSKDIHNTLIKAAADLICEETPNYQYVTARLINFDIRKEVYGSFEPHHIKDVIHKNIKLGYYDSEILKSYTDAELDTINDYIRHDRDDTLTYAGMEQLRGKYLVQDRTTKQLFESPQILFMMVAATLFQRYDKKIRMRYVKDFYDAVSTFDISLPTPIMAGVRTPQRQFSSCVLIESDDSLDSINATSTSIVKYVSQKAGIGISAGAIRAVGSKIRNGDAVHTGQIPFLKKFQASVKSCSQGGVRGGAATVYYPMWHKEYENLVVLKNNKGTEETRVRHMDYGVQLNRMMYQRFVDNANITLFSPSDVPGLLDAFYADQDEFDRLYVKYEKDSSIPRKVISAYDAFDQLLTERKSTGRIYIQNIDNCNTHSPFIESVAPIKMSNLCAEIGLPTHPLQSEHDGATHRVIKIAKDYSEEFKAWRTGEKRVLFRDIPVEHELVDYLNPADEAHDYFPELVVDEKPSEIALCTLAAVNLGNAKDPDWFRKPCELLVRALDEVLSYQNYPVIAAEVSTIGRRNLGVGIVNLAYFFAKNGVKYDESALPLLDEYMEAWSYYLIKASNDIAKEKGACKFSDQTKYSKGILPIDTYKKTVDELVPHVERMPWNDLRESLKEHGIRNSTLMALMPSETSSQISNSTNGIEPPRGYVSVKASKDGILRQVVPGFPRLKNKYDLLWDQKNPQGYIKVVSVIQKYVDQAISINTSYDPSKYDENLIPQRDMFQDLLDLYRYGAKNLYYFNTRDGMGEEEDAPESKDEDKQIIELPPLPDDEGCDGCIL